MKMQTILKYREILLGLVYAAYLGLIHPNILARLQTANPQNPDRWLGLLIFSLPFLDFAGNYLKRPVLVHFARQNQSALGGKIPWLANLLPWAHILLVGVLGICFLVVFNIYALFEGTFLEGFSFIIALVFPGLIWMFPEGEILLYFRSPFGEDEHKWEKYAQVVASSPLNSPAHFFGLWYLAIRPRYPDQLGTVDYLKDALGDFLLLVFAMLGYTMIFDLLGINAPLRLSQSPALALFDLVRVMVLFAILYPPLRSVHFFMEQIQPRSELQKILSAISFTTVLIAVLFTMPHI